MLIRHVREKRRGAFDEKNRVEIEQRIGQGQLAHGPPSAEVQSFPLGSARLSRGQRALHVFEFRQGVGDRRAQALLARREPAPPLDGFQDPVGGRRRVRRPALGPLADAALGGRFRPGNVRLEVGTEDFDFIEVEVVLRGQGESHVARGTIDRLNEQRALIRLPAECRFGMLINHVELLSIHGKPQLDPVIARGEGITPIPQHDPGDPCDFAQVHLPPRVRLVGGVESPLAGLDPIDASGGILRRRDDSTARVLTQ